MTVAPILLVLALFVFCVLVAEIYLTARESERLAAVISEAKQLLAPETPTSWPTFDEETLDGAIRNMLQVKVSALGVMQLYDDALFRVAEAAGVRGEWTINVLVEAVWNLRNP